MKFTQEEIANYRKTINSAKETEALAKNDASSGIYYGAEREAALARLEVKRIVYAAFPAALDEIERLRAALEDIIFECGMAGMGDVSGLAITTMAQEALKGGE